MTKISDIGSVRTVVETFLQKGIRDIVISPGSRNAPFVLSFTALSEFHCYSVLDERSAGFIALGMAQQTGRPVAICCTSGSAVLNYAPALVEAYYQNIPLIALTADRPDEWIDQGEGQSIRQRNLLDGFSLKSFHLAQEMVADDQWFNQRMVAEAIEICLSQNQGPVHINVPLREPLYKLADRSPLPRKPFKIAQTNPNLDSDELLKLSSIWSSAKSVMIIVSQGKHPAGLIEQLKILNDDPRVAILTETTANLYHLGFVACIDRTIEHLAKDEEVDQFIPELIISIGGNIISKKLKALIRSKRDLVKYHWHFGAQVLDTFQSLTHLLPIRSDRFLKRMIEVESAIEDGQFGVLWRSKFFTNEQLHEDFLSSAPYSDLKVFEMIHSFIPDDSVVQMGNSSVVRYFQLFNQHRGVLYFGNRGVSGIEGCVSTAVGAAMAQEKLVLHVSGDHAFRYDSNALLNHRPNNLRIIVINNGGGNIFRIIPGPENHQATDAFIEAANDQSIKQLVEYSGAKYFSANDLTSLEEGLMKLIDPEFDECSVLEVFTPRLESPDVLKSYFNSLS